MKKPLATLVLLSAFLLSSCGQFGYVIKRQKVIYAIWDGSGRIEYTLEGADPKSFYVIKQNRYAKDRNTAYYRQKVIKGAIPSTFRMLDDWYAIDSESVFMDGAVLPDKDAETFEVLNGYWTRDKNDVYFINRAIVACDPISFEAVLNEWAVDSECIYSGETKIDDLDKDTFHALNSYYARDNRYVYSRFNRRTALTDSVAASSAGTNGTDKLSHPIGPSVRKVLDANAESFTAIDIRACDYDARDQYRCYSRGEAAPCNCRE